MALNLYLVVTHTDTHIILNLQIVLLEVQSNSRGDSCVGREGGGKGVVRERAEEPVDTEQGQLKGAGGTGGRTSVKI